MQQHPTGPTPGRRVIMPKAIVGDDRCGEAARGGRRCEDRGIGGRSMSDPKYHDKHAADIYRAIALRFYCRYVDMRHSAENCGADLTGSHGRLPTGLEATEQ